MYINWSTRLVSLSMRIVAIGRLSCLATVSFDILQRYDFVRLHYSENQFGDINCSAVNRCTDRSNSIIIVDILMMARWQKIMRLKTEGDTRINERGAVKEREETRMKKRERCSQTEASGFLAGRPTLVSQFKFCQTPLTMDRVWNKKNTGRGGNERREQRMAKREQSASAAARRNQQPRRCDRSVCFLKSVLLTNVPL